MDDFYNQIGKGCSAEIKVKGSKFIGEAALVHSTQEAESFLLSVQKREYTATHHCWAYRIGATGSAFRYNDDGEPAGTAGQPILRHIDGIGITNVIVVVTRYFGGTKLGTGGLIRAYGDAAKEVLSHCPIERITIREQVAIVFDYDDTSLAMHTINKYDSKILKSAYGTRTTLTLAVKKSDMDPFKSDFVNTLRGRGELVTAD